MELDAQADADALTLSYAQLTQVQRDKELSSVWRGWVAGMTPDERAKAGVEREFVNARYDDFRTHQDSDGEFLQHTIADGVSLSQLPDAPPEDTDLIQRSPVAAPLLRLYAKRKAKRDVAAVLAFFRFPGLNMAKACKWHETTPRALRDRGRVLAGELDLDDGDFVLFDVLVWITNRPLAKMAILIVLRAIGATASDAETLQTMSERVGVCRQDAHREEKRCRLRYGLAKTRFNRSEETSEEHYLCNRRNLGSKPSSGKPLPARRRKLSKDARALKACLTCELS